MVKHNCKQKYFLLYICKHCYHVILLFIIQLYRCLMGGFIEYEYLRYQSRNYIISFMEFGSKKKLRTKLLK